MRAWRWILLIVLTVTLFYWKLVFTKQFTILWQWEPVTQSYSWYHFAAASLHKGILPIWDPYRFSGSTFIGEMQTGLFYPLKFLAYAMPLDRDGLFSERVYNGFYVLTHILAALFMYAMARRLKLSPLAGLIAGLSFSLGGYLGNTGHPHTLDSGIWVPLIALFFLRATEESSFSRSGFFACISGLALGMTVLGGGIHMVLMSGIVIGTMALMIMHRSPYRMRIVVAAGIVAVVGFLYGAVQLLPSLEYGPLSYRWVGSERPIGFRQKVPYEFLGGIARFSPRSLFTFLFGAANPGDHLPSNYFGVLPFVLSIIGAWRNWHERWVKYFTAVALAAYFYAWGDFSFLHGILYLIPGLDIAREAGRFILLTHFASAILAGYGIDAMFGAIGPKEISFGVFVRALRWLVIFLAALLIAGSIQTTIAIDDWFFLSFTFIAATYVVIELVHRGYRSVPIQAAVILVLLWDVYEFNYPVRNKAVMAAQKQDYMAQLHDAKKLADFLKQQQPQPFRVHFESDAPPNIGDAYGIEMTSGMAATMLTDYFPYLGHPKMPQLLNVRYTLSRSDRPNATPVYSDGTWRVYENPGYGSRAWIVHASELDASDRRPSKRLDDPAFDPTRVAIVDREVVEGIDVPTSTATEAVHTITNNQFQIESKGRGLLVISEVFSPGWKALLNERPASIYRVDGVLRGVAVPDGRSTVRLEYRPSSVRIGFAMTIVALAATVILGCFVLLSRQVPK